MIVMQKNLNEMNFCILMMWKVQSKWERENDSLAPIMINLSAIHRCMKHGKNNAAHLIYP
jgi:hypothetical protein